MNKRFAAADLALCPLISSCTPGTIPSKAPARACAEEHEAPKSSGLAGSRKQSNSMSDLTHQEAVVEDGVIIIRWAMDDGGAKSLH
ncbi:hypothetical protein [Glutamicibacter arilaitensis]|uniref:hypothetical protein n=1 Tax=Glutamicibacter arilaitensis TaxID=256701 RepID=UPI003F9945DA